MSQIWHIFKKDIRYLRLEISLLVILPLWYAREAIHDLSQFPRVSSPSSGLALILLAIFVIARVVHAEAIPGDKQFWITRPYRWNQLLAAKVLFVLVFVHGSLLMAQLIIVHADHFPLLPNLSALLWSQVLFFICLSLPTAALGAITTGLVSFALSVLALITAIGVLLPRGPMRGAFSIFEVDWVRSAAVMTVLLASAVVVLLMQYRYRRSLQVRIFGAAAALLGMTVYWTLPLTFDLEAQTRTAFQPAGMSSIQVVMNQYFQKSGKLADVSPAESVLMRLPLALTGVPEGSEGHIDALDYEFEGEDGRTWGLGPTRFAQPAYSMQTDISMDNSFFNAEHKAPVTFRVTAYLTVFGKTEEQTVAPQPYPASVDFTPQLHCTEDYQDHLKCRAALRRPPQLLSAIVDNETHPLRFELSYSPFPAELSLNPIQEEDFLVPLTKSQVTFVMRQPLAHLRRDLELRNVNLDDFVVKP